MVRRGGAARNTVLQSGIMDQLSKQKPSAALYEWFNIPDGGWKLATAPKSACVRGKKRKLFHREGRRKLKEGKKLKWQKAMTSCGIRPDSLYLRDAPLESCSEQCRLVSTLWILPLKWTALVFCVWPVPGIWLNRWVWTRMITEPFPVHGALGWGTCNCHPLPRLSHLYALCVSDGGNSLDLPRPCVAFNLRETKQKWWRVIGHDFTSVRSGWILLTLCNLMDHLDQVYSVMRCRRHW